jgi:glyoxylase-like metal-dependent hydrolase (beta-lactamase superfamily II)
MITDIKTIILGGFNGNCYLLTTEKGFVLIDTGRKSKRKKLEQALISEGCKPGNLDLIILTHGDFDHTGNCVYLREKYKTIIAMHQYDVGMVEYGDMFWNRQTGNIIMKKLVNLTFNIRRFTPDFHLDEHSDLSTYGLNAKVLYLPGHSKGSIGILTSEKNLFCGDLFTNQKKPESNSLVDNLHELNESIDKVKSLGINTVYPGHGQPFQMSSYK